MPGDARKLATEMTLGARHACARGDDGRVRCWSSGSRQDGIVAANETTARSRDSDGGAQPVTVRTLEGGELTQASALDSWDARTCAVAPDGVRCWTFLGGHPPAKTNPNAPPHGPSASDAGPVSAASLEVASPHARLVAIGGALECVALGSPEKVYCANSGELGRALREPPVVNQPVRALTAGQGHACAVLPDGRVTCWGKNDAGQLGNGQTTDASAPVVVEPLPPVEDVRAGYNHTCALLRNKTVACWGANGSFQLASGSRSPSSRPLAVQGLVGVTHLAVRGDSACARLTDGSVRCWGDNHAGQLGDGTLSDHAVPMPVRAAPRR